MSGRDIGIIALIVVGVLVLVPLLGGMGGWGMGPGMMGPGMMGGYGPGGWGGWWGMHFFGGLFWVLVIVGVVLVINSLVRRGGVTPWTGPTETPLDILKRRLAKGEITMEQYEALKKELS